MVICSSTYLESTAVHTGQFNITSRVHQFKSYKHHPNLGICNRLSFQAFCVFDLPPDLLEGPKLILALPLAPQLDRRTGRGVPVIG